MLVAKVSGVGGVVTSETSPEAGVLGPAPRVDVVAPRRVAPSPVPAASFDAPHDVIGTNKADKTTSVGMARTDGLICVRASRGDRRRAQAGHSRPVSVSARAGLFIMGV